ncbi:hypothetical protein D3C85_1636090 [compost metagenome]
MGFYLLLYPGRARGLVREQAFDQRGNLLPRQDAEQAYQSDHGGRWRAHVEERVDDPDQQAEPQRNQVDLHQRPPISLRGR